MEDRKGHRGVSLLKSVLRKTADYWIEIWCFVKVKEALLYNITTLLNKDALKKSPLVWKENMIDLVCKFPSVELFLIYYIFSFAISADLFLKNLTLYN